jgi:hypothetical protein
MARGIPTQNLQMPTTQPTGIPSARQQQVGLALSALSDVLGKRDPIAGTMQRQAMLQAQQMQAEQKKKQEELNKKLDDAIDKSNLPQSQKDLLKSLNVQTKAQTLMQAYEPTKEDLTAAQKNLRAYQEIEKTGTPEEIQIARAALIGIRQGKSKEQLRNEVVANLIKQVNPLTGEPYSKEDIEQQIKILDSFYGKTEEIEVEQDKPITFSIPGYTITEG